MKNQAICPPEWLSKNAVYQINPRTFSKEGTLNAITKELPFLKELGFNIIYLCSICEADEVKDEASMSPRQIASKTGNPKNMYILSDYFSVDEEYGTMEDLKNLVNRAHELEMKVLLDIVYAHIGKSSKLLKEHPEFIKHDQEGNLVASKWSSMLIDSSNIGLREYLYCNMVYYIAVIGADGFRCDVGDYLPSDFWKTARERIQSVKKDAVLVNESASYVNMATAFDSNYCFHWHNALRNIFCGYDPASKLKETYEYVVENAPSGAKVLRDIENHDSVTDWNGRCETIAGHDGMEQIEVINYLIDGIPMVYCGNELACEAKVNMFANRFYPGDYEVTDRQNKNSEASVRRQNIMKILNKMKSESDLLCYGETAWIDTCSLESVVSFKRTLGENEIMFFGNAKENDAVIDVKDLIKDKKCILYNGEHKIENGMLHLSAREYAVFA